QRRQSALHRQEDANQDLRVVHALPRRPQDGEGPRRAAKASRAHPRSGGAAHGTAHQARPAADEQTENLRRSVAPAPGAATRRIQIGSLIRREIVADTKTKKTYYLGTGRRKTAVARVRLCEGSGQIVINGRGLDEFFTEAKDRNAVTGPL